MNTSPIGAWHSAVLDYNPNVLDDILDANCTFFSPVIFKPQQGKRLVKMYLETAFELFKEAGDFEYIKEVENRNCAVLEFNATLDGIVIDGIDMITWNEHGLVTEFKVMVRPIKAVEMIKNKMAEKLNQLSTAQKLKFKAGILFDKIKS